MRKTLKILHKLSAIGMSGGLVDAAGAVCCQRLSGDMATALQPQAVTPVVARVATGARIDHLFSR
jgi:hypothetical protein